MIEYKKEKKNKRKSKFIYNIKRCAKKIEKSY